MILVAQAAGFLAMAANVISFQFKSARSIILCQLLGSILFAVNMFMLDAVMGGLLNIIGIMRALVYINLKRHQGIVNCAFMLLYLLSYILTFALFGKDPTAFNLVAEFFPLIGMGAMTIGLSLKQERAIRICGFINSPCWLIYNTLNMSVGGILCEIFSIASVTTAYIRLDRKKKQ